MPNPESDSDTSIEDSSYEDCSLQLSDLSQGESGSYNINKINEKIQEINKTLSQYSEKIKDIDIPIKWDIPKTHKPSAGGFHKINYKVKKYKNATKGSLEDDELDYLRKRLKKFFKKHNLPNESIKALTRTQLHNQYKLPNDLRLKFLQYICKDLKDRTPLVVYNYISKLGLRRGGFLPEEDDFLMFMHSNYSRPDLYSICGLLLNRNRYNIYRRMKRLRDINTLGSRPKVVTKSTSELSERILGSILSRRIVDLERLTKLKRNAWKSIGRENSVSPAHAKGVFLFDLWPRIFSKPIKFYEFCSHLILRLHDLEPSSLDDIKWPSFAKDLNNANPAFTYLMLRKLVMTYVPSCEWNDLRRCIKYLYDEILPEMKKHASEEVMMKKIELSD